MSELNDYYISFGQDHAHRVNGKTFDCDCLACIKAKDMDAARQRAFELFGPKWFTSYPEHKVVKMVHYFPRGVINVE